MVRAAAYGDSLSGLKAALSETVSQQQSNMAMITGNEVEVAPPTVNGGSPSGPQRCKWCRLTYNLRRRRLVTPMCCPLMTRSSLPPRRWDLDDIELDPASLNAVQEVFSQVSGPVINTLSEKTGMTIMPEPAQCCDSRYFAGSPIRRIRYMRGTRLPWAMTTATIYEIFENSFAARLSTVPAAVVVSSRPACRIWAAVCPVGQGMQGMSSTGRPNGRHGAEHGGRYGKHDGRWDARNAGGGANVQSVQFPSLQQQGGGSEQGNIGLLMDVYMEMTVELGRTKKLIREILRNG